MRDSQSPAKWESQSIGFLFLISAHNEASFIRKTLLCIKQQLSLQDAVVVIADNCTDETAQIAQAEGAKVLVRENDTNLGKSASLAWFASQYAELIEQYLWTIVLDADSQISDGFLPALRKIHLDEQQVYQAFINPVYEIGTPLGKIAGLSELNEQMTNQLYQRIYNFPIRLRGTGMIIPQQVLLAYFPQLSSTVEDIELSLFLENGHVHVSSLYDLCVHDPKPRKADYLVNQRSRWIKGQGRILWSHKGMIWRILICGPRTWPLLCSLFYKPKSLFVLMHIGLAVLFWRENFLGWVFLIYPIWSAFLFLIGFLSIQNKIDYLRALYTMPFFIILWIWSSFQSLWSTDWKKAR
jgi:cellulose synthase/poly-beta-1,6-N-acetylglucosamine synthase-like glycosyltransferase